MKTIISTILLCFICLQTLQAQDGSTQEKKRIKVFAAYEIGEAAFNKFQSLSGEIGIRFPNNHQLRLTHMNVGLTEEHLSSGFAGAVDGDNVEGDMFGFELFYDFPVWKGLQIAPSIGYYKNDYRHTSISATLSNKSVTLGAAISYQEVDIFKLRGLYYRFSIPMRTTLNPIEETSLGAAVIQNNHFGNNIWMFIGYQF